MPEFKLRLPVGEMAAVDRVRGLVPRERWVRELCREAVAAHDGLASDGLDAASHGIVREQAAEARESGSVQVEAGSAVPAAEGSYVSPFVGRGAKSSNLKDVIG